MQGTRQEAGKPFGRLFLAEDALEILNYSREEQIERKEQVKDRLGDKTAKAVGWLTVKGEGELAGRECQPSLNNDKTSSNSDLPNVIRWKKCICPKLERPS